MKITLNLSPAASARDRYALAWAIPATLVGLAALVFLSRASLREYREYREIQHQLADVQMHAEELSNREAEIRRKFEYPAYRDLLRQSRFVNNLIDQRELSLTELSARLAGLLPENAHLTGLALTSPKKPGDDYAVRMGITAKGEDAVETFVNDLEDSPDFKDVSIINQGFQEEASQGQQVSLVCTARYLPGVEEESEAGGQKSEGGSQGAGDRSQNKIQRPKAASQKSEKGAGHSGAEKSTPNSKPNL
jgi:hypothetical protein